MSGRLVKRAAKLTLAKPQVTARGGAFGAFFGVQPNGIEIGGVDVDNGLRFSFEIEKTLESKPNFADLVIYNLSEQSRAALQTKPLNVRLDVGYDGNLERLFVGDLRWAEHRHNSTAWETRMQVGDGERAYNHARVNRSFRGGVTRREAVSEAVGAMGLSLPDAIGAVPGMGDVFAGGLSMSGPAHRELSRALAPTGADWSVQDGRMQILAGSAVRNDAAVLISEETGMIGSPEYGPPKERGKPPILAVKMLLYPGLTPGGLIKVESAAVKGVFKMVRIVHAGDTQQGSDWYSTIEARAR